MAPTAKFRIAEKLEDDLGILAAAPRPDRKEAGGRGGRSVAARSTSEGMSAAALVIRNSNSRCVIIVQRGMWWGKTPQCECEERRIQSIGMMSVESQTYTRAIDIDICSIRPLWYNKSIFF
jgi:hypothetical protein